jgi:hypothetical protein
MCDKSPKVTPQHSTAERGLLLGCAGWPQPVWRNSYFPTDLPPDWRFAYYRNEADCLLLPAGEWAALDPQQREDWLDDLPEHFRFYLQLSSDDTLAALHLDALGANLGALLAPVALDAPPGVPLWTPCGEGAWGDGEPRLLRWTLDGRDLRVWRQRVEAMPPGVRALVFDSASANPRQLWEIRQLLQLLGLA